MAVLEERHFASLVRKALVAELLDAAHEGTVVDERLIDPFAFAVGAEIDAFRLAAVGIVGTDIEPREHGNVCAQGQLQVHELVLMAQVLVFGVVGRGVVDARAEGDALVDVDTDTTHESVGVAMLAAGVVQRVFHQVERRALQHECRTGHVASRPVVVADGTEGYHAGTEAVERLGADVALQRVLRIVKIHQSAIALRKRRFSLDDVVDCKARQGGCIVMCQPGI